MKNFETVLAQAKKEILSDIKEGIVPNTVTSFSDLHDFVDANYYGGFCDENYKASKDFEFENEIQTKLDEWIKSEEFKNQFKK
ncbi:MAG: hypothetical protein H7Y10_03470 [Flavobacterium sp.]|nr:hypothetical protein [Flavobacterium sp.]